jgi:MinD-like ATPase involved in chromosome partitioning or flagellar assembly
MARFITIASGKGGVGKTTVAVNLAAALGKLGKDVTTPHVGISVGLPHEKTLNDYLKGEARFDEVLYYNPHGFKVIPAALSLEALSGTDFTRAEELKANFREDQIVLIDSAPCFGKEGLSALQMGDEVLFVTTPYQISVADVTKGALIAKMLNKKILGLVINKEMGMKQEMTMQEISFATSLEIMGRFLDHEDHLKGLAVKAPLVTYKENHTNTKEYMNLASRIAGVPYQKKKRFFLFSMFGR